MAGTEQQSGMRIFSVPVQAGKSSFWNLALAIPPYHHQVPLLAGDSQEPERHLRLHQPWAGGLSAGN